MSFKLDTACTRTCSKMQKCPHGYHYTPKSGMCNYHGDPKNYVSPKYDELEFPNFPPLSQNPSGLIPPPPPSTPAEGSQLSQPVDAGELTSALDKLALEQAAEQAGGAYKSKYRKHSLSKRRSLKRKRASKKSSSKKRRSSKKKSKCKRRSSRH